MLPLLLFSCDRSAKKPAADNAEEYLRRGHQFLADDRPDPAIEQLSRAIELKPDYADAYLTRGSTYLQEGNVAGAVDDFTRLIELKPDSALAYQLRATAYLRQEDYEKALADVEAGKNLQPGSVTPEMRKSFSQFEMLIKWVRSRERKEAEPRTDDGHRRAARRPHSNPLIAAAGEGDIEGLKKLLADGAEVDATDEEGNTALRVAAGEGHADAVRALLEAGADPNKRTESGFTPLFYAASKSPEVVRLLLEHGADPNIAGRGGGLPLHKAAIFGNLEVAGLLVEAGAEPSQEVAHPATGAAEGKNAIYIALQHGHLDVARYLADNGAELDIWTASALGRTRRMEEILDRRPGLLAMPGRYCFTPLHFAATWGQPEAAELLLTRGASPDATERKRGETALHGAAAMGHEAVVRVLLEHGADPNATDTHGRTPLDRAKAHHGRLELDARTVADRQAVIELLEGPDAR